MRELFISVVTNLLTLGVSFVIAWLIHRIIVWSETNPILSVLWFMIFLDISARSSR